MAPMSSSLAPLFVRHSLAARRSLSKASSKSRMPFAKGMLPSATHAFRASSTRWKSGDKQRTPIPASECAIPSSSPRICAPSLMSAGAESPSTRPQCPPAILPSNMAAQRALRSGGWPPRSLTAVASSTLAVRMASASFATSASASGSLASPTTSSMRLVSNEYRHKRAEGTLAGTAPWARDRGHRRRCGRPCQRAGLSLLAASDSSEHRGSSTEASAARRAAAPDASALSGVSLAVEPASRFRSDVGRPWCADGGEGRARAVVSSPCRALRAAGAPAGTSITLLAASPQSVGGGSDPCARA
eukprot:6174752-Pleurochrysis_carterae.AAC.1